MSKSIRLSEGAYERLAAHKRDDETFSEVVLRLAGDGPCWNLPASSTTRRPTNFGRPSRNAESGVGRTSKESPTKWAERSVLLDTSFLIDLMNGDEGAVATARELERDLIQQRVSAMTLFELHYGVVRASQSEDEQQKVENVLSSKPVHPADTAVMRNAGRLSGELSNDGTPVDDGDVTIAATADVVDEPVLTTDETTGVSVSSLALAARWLHRRSR
jgi:predicted nucleic acid-binding protein